MDPVVQQSTGSRRIGWETLPLRVRSGIEKLLGSAAVRAVGQPGGFSEGLAARVLLADGRGVFIKSASSLLSPAVAGHHRREATVSSQLPEHAPVPRLLDVYDDGIWIALIFEEIAGHLPEQPWKRNDLDRVLDEITRLTEIFTPSPVAEKFLGEPRLGGWLALSADAIAVDKIRPLSPWATDHIERLVALEQKAPSVLSGDTLLHGDLYPFNIMLTGDEVSVVDWPHAWVGARHCDVVTLMSSASLSGIDPQGLAENHPLTRDLEPDQIDVMLAAHAGFLLRIAASAETAADQSLIGMMVALARGSLNWLQARESRSA